MSPPRTRWIRKLLRWPSPARGPTSARPLPQPPLPRPACATSVLSTGCVASPCSRSCCTTSRRASRRAASSASTSSSCSAGSSSRACSSTSTKAPGGSRSGSFWIRRARRLLPALFVVLAAVGIYAVVFLNRVDAHHVAVDGVSSFFYVANWHFIDSGQTYIQQFLESRRARCGTCGHSRSRSSSTWCGR